MIPVFILGLYDTGLYTAQLLGKHGIQVFGFDYIANNPGFFSKYINATIVQNPDNNCDDVLNKLIAKARSFQKKPILIASSDLFLNFIHENRQFLEKYFIINLPSSEILENIINKSGQFEMANRSNIQIPFHYVINNEIDLKELKIEKLKYPLIIRGDAQQKWKSANLSKSYIVYNYEDIIRLSKFLIEKKVSFILQHIISGPITNNYEYNALVLGGKIIESSLIRKIRQYPAPYGAAICVETCKNKILEDLGKKFVLDNKIEGFSNTEFKIDPLDGTIYFIETNARVWLQIKLTQSLNQNFLLSYYNYIFPNSISKSKIKPFKNVKWVDLFGDLMYFIRIDKSFKSLRSILSSYHNASSFGLLNIYDIKPFIKSIQSILQKK